MDHMSTGGKKDATFIMEQFKEKVNEINETTQLVDCLFFNVVSNVKTAGAILCTTFSQAMCFHCGDHALFLFFSGLSKLKQIRSVLV